MCPFVVLSSLDIGGVGKKSFSNVGFEKIIMNNVGWTHKGVLISYCVITVFGTIGLTETGCRHYTINGR
jgi:hypothetical protein